jgi:hypothetical protein
VSQLRKTSSRSSRRPSTLHRRVAIAAVAITLVVPAGALAWSDPPSGISGPTNQGAATQQNLFERTATELGHRVEGPVASDRVSLSPAPTAGDGFSWADAGIGAGAVVGLAAVTGAAFLIRRRAHPAPRPAI